MLYSRAELFRVHGECRALRIIEELRLCYILRLQSCSGFMENAEL